MRYREIMIVFLSVVIILLFPLQMNAKESDKLVKNPDRYLFNLSNMKPGDYASRKLTIQNRGNEDFTYNMKAQFTKGSKELFNEFTLVVRDSSGTLYDGKLKEFTHVVARNLKAKHEEDLLFTVTFPETLGNEFQSLTFEMALLFYVEGKAEAPSSSVNDNPEEQEDLIIKPERPITDSTSPPKADQNLPSTATTYFNIAMIGALFILLGGIEFFKKRKK